MKARRNCWPPDNCTICPLPPHNEILGFNIRFVFQKKLDTVQMPTFRCPMKRRASLYNDISIMKRTVASPTNHEIFLCRRKSLQSFFQVFIFTIFCIEEEDLLRREATFIKSLNAHLGIFVVDAVFHRDFLKVMNIRNWCYFCHSDWERPLLRRSVE